MMSYKFEMMARRVRSGRLRSVRLVALGLICAGMSISANGQPGHDHHFEERGNTHTTIGKKTAEGQPGFQPEQVATGRVVHGFVFEDIDGDGLRSAGDDGVAGVGVSNGVDIVLTDEQGGYELRARLGIGLIYISIPRGYGKDARWYRHVASLGEAASSDFALVPSVESGSFKFAQTSDTHIGIAQVGKASFVTALERIGAQRDPPAFIITTGDLVDRGSEQMQYRDYVEAVASTALPYFNVFGNHDQDRSGVDTYRRYVGPDYYSFDFRDCHFLIINSTFESRQQSAWIKRDLELLAPGKRLFVFQHHPPTQHEHDRFAAMGAVAVFSGHYHAQRAVKVGEMKSYSTTTLLFGGIDCSPAGFRMVEVEGSSVTTRTRWMTDGAMIRLVSPQAQTVQVHGSIPLIVNAYETSTRFGRCRYTLFRGENLVAEGSLMRQGDWSWRADIPLPERLGVDPRGPDAFELHVRLIDDRGLEYELDSFFSVVDSPTPTPKPGGLWAQFGGSARRGGLASSDLPTPLSLVWAADTGGELLFSSPVLRDGRVYVGVKGHGDFSNNGVVALDAATGERLWFGSTPTAVVHTVATDATHVYAASQGGMLHAFDLETGVEAWSQTLGSDNQRFVNGSPVVSRGEVFAGSFGHFARFRTSDGQRRWGRRWGSDLTGFGSPATDGTLVVVPGFWKPKSLQAVSRTTGSIVWQYEARGLHGSPVIAGDGVVFTDYEGEIVRVTLADGALVWRSPLGGNRSASTPAVKGEIVVAGGVGHIRAFNLTDGRILWDVETRRSSLNMAPFHSDRGALVGSPTISGGTAYVPCGDGWLYAIDLASGTVLWEMDFGVPILSAPCIAGGFLYLSTFDGHVYAFAPEQQCAGDCDSSTGFGVLDIFDFLCFQNSFVLSDAYACDCDTTTGRGVCDLFDFLCFQDAFVAGCP